MKSLVTIILVCFSLFAMSQTHPQVVKHSISSSIGGTSTDTTTLVTEWVYEWAFANTSNHIIDGQFTGIESSGTANYTFAVEKSFDYVNWVAMTTETQTTGVDTVIYFSDTTNWPYIRVRNTAISGAQVITNKVFYSIVN